MTKKVRFKFFKKIFCPLLFTLLAAAVPAVCLSQTPTAWINEIHYDNGGGNIGEFVEVVGKSSDTFDLDKVTLTEYNENNGEKVKAYTLDEFTLGEKNNNYTIYVKKIAGLQKNGNGLALDYEGRLIQFISSEGSFTATEGPANGIASTNIGISEPGSVGTDKSLQLTGTGLAYDNFSWLSSSDESPGEVNKGQILYPTVQFIASSSTINESSKTVTIVASISKPEGDAVSVDVNFLNSVSSANPEDFTGKTTQTITFGPDAADGDTQEVTFTIKNDEQYEGEEFATFELTNLSTSGTTRLGSPYAFTVTITDDDDPGVVINEFLADPPGSHAEDLEGDANKDGVRSSNDDEFIEILNMEDVSVDISNWVLSSDGTDDVFKFPDGTSLYANSAAVVFGGGTPTGSFGGSLVFTTKMLSLSNSGGNVTLKDANGTIVDHHSYGSEARSDESLVRNPDGTGNFVRHISASGSGGEPFSPGTSTDGSLFSSSITIQGNAGWRMLSAPIEDMTISELTDDASIRGTGTSEDKNFYTGYDGRSFIAPANLSGNLTSGKGFILYFFDNGKKSNQHLPVTLDVSAAKEPSSDVTVSLHQNGDGWNLVGNPFLKTIDISQINNWTASGTDTLASRVAQIWDERSQSFILTTNNDNKVAAWQGFFIQNSTADKLIIPKDAKNNSTQFYKTNNDKGYVALTLKGENKSTKAHTVDRSAVLYFSEKGTYGWDANDATKLHPLTSQYALLSIVTGQKGNRTLKAQDSRPYDFSGEIAYNLIISANNMSGDFTLGWNKQNIPREWEFHLIDHETGEEIDMNAVESYNFELHATSKKSAGFESDIEKSLPEAASLKAENTETPRFTIKVSNTNIIRQSDNDLPESVKLNPNYPNPFNPSTTISYELAEDIKVKLSIWNIVGQKVATLVDGVMDAGEHKEIWNANDMPSGIYIAQLEVGGNVYIRKMTLIK